MRRQYRQLDYLNAFLDGCSPQELVKKCPSRRVDHGAAVESAPGNMEEQLMSSHSNIMSEAIQRTFKLTVPVGHSAFRGTLFRVSLLVEAHPLGCRPNQGR